MKYQDLHASIVIFLSGPVESLVTVLSSITSPTVAASSTVATTLRFLLAAGISTNDLGSEKCPNAFTE